MSAWTCITCQVAFNDADLQRYHYKTDWHRYNLKRKVADMPPVTAETFQERVVNAQKVQLEDGKKDADQCQICSKHFSTKNAYANHIQSKKHKEMESKQQLKDAKKAEKQTADKNLTTVQVKNAKNQEEKNKTADTSGGADPGPSSSSQAEPSVPPADRNMEVDSDKEDAESWESWDGEPLGIEECLFCSHVSSTMEKNVQHMTLQHSFFIPDLDFVCDLERLITYLGEKVGEGHICLWCNEKGRSFFTTHAVQQHMVDKSHCKMLHEGDAIFEYADFYDYRSSYPDYEKPKDNEEKMEEGGGKKEEEEEVVPDVIEAENYQLVLPSGAVIGHRSLQRYYRQKLRPDRQVVLRNPSALNRVMAHYKSLGWTGTTGVLALKKAKDLSLFHRVRSRHHMQVGVKANKLQPHFRRQILGC